MFIEASGEVTFTHENPRTGQPVEESAHRRRTTARPEAGAA